MPSYTFSEDSNTGIAKTSEDNLTLVTGGSSRLTIDSSGNVGINTTSPGATLDVQGAVPNIRVLGTTIASWAMQQVLADGTSRFIINSANTDGRRFDIGQGPQYGANGTLFIKDQTAGSVRFALDPNGNIGIGTTTPGQKLHVEGSVNVSTSINTPVINTTLATQNLTISSAAGSVIIRLG